METNNAVDYAADDSLLRWYRLTANRYLTAAAEYTKNCEDILAKREKIKANYENGLGLLANFFAGCAQAMWCRATLRRSKGFYSFGINPTSGEMWTIPEIVDACINTCHFPFHEWKTTRQLWEDSNKQTNFVFSDYETSGVSYRKYGPLYKE